MDNIVSKEQMESLKALSDTNIKISEAKNLLFQLQEEETEYLVLREKKAMDRIQDVLDQSREVLREADSNHALVKELLAGITEFVAKLVQAQQEIRGIKEGFEQRNVEWEKTIEKQQDELAEEKKQIKTQRVQLENDKKTLEIASKQLMNDQIKLNSDRGALERAIKRLKDNKI